MIQGVSDLDRYFIQPHYSGVEALYRMSKNADGSVALDVLQGGAKARLPKGHAKALSDCYRNSRFFGYPIMISGVIVRVDKRKHLYLDDIMLEAEYLGMTSSRNYLVRYQNLVSRFLSGMSFKYIKAVFSQMFSDNSLDCLIEQFIKTQKTTGFTFRKNVPFRFDPNEKVCETDFLKSERCRIDSPVVGKVNVTDGKGDVIQADAVLGFNVSSSGENGCGEKTCVMLSNFTDGEKIKIHADLGSYLNNWFTLKSYDLLGHSGSFLVI